MIPTTLGALRANWKKGLFAVICGTCIGVPIALYQNASTPAVVISDMHEEDGVVQIGQMMQISVHVKRVRYCMATTQRFLWRPRWVDDTKQDMQAHPWGDAPDGPEVVPMQPQMAPFPLTEGRFTMLLPIPADLPGGDWFYIPINDDHCNVNPWSAKPRQPPFPGVRVHVDERLHG